MPAHRLPLLFLSVLVIACGGAPQSQPVTPTNPAKVAIKVPPPPALDSAAPTPLGQLCATAKTTGAPTWVSLLEDAKKVDAELARKLTDISKSNTCSTDVAGFDAVDLRLSQAGTLCDEKYRDGGVKKEKMKAAVAGLRAALHAALEKAAKAADQKACQKVVTSEALPALVGKDQGGKHTPGLIDLFVSECSSPGDLEQANCRIKIDAACKADPVAPSARAEALACAKELGMSGDRSAGAPDGSRDPGDSTERALGGAALETAILTGAAEFLAKGAEQELSLFAADILADRLCGETSPAKPFLPKTCELLDPDSDDPVIGATPAALRAAAKADLENLPVEVLKHLEKKDENLACAAAFAWGTTEEIARGVALADLLKDPTPVLDKPLVKTYCAEFEAAIKGLAEHIKARLNEAPALAESLRSGQVDRLLALDQTLRSDEELRATVREVLLRLKILDQAVKTHRENPSDDTRAAMITAALQTVAPILVYVAPNTKDDVHTTVKLISEVLNRDFTAALVTAAQLEVLMCDAPGGGDPREKLATEAKKSTRSCFLPPNARNALSLAAGLAQAESSDDVRGTLEDAALPLGSWRRKNERRFGGTLTGMVGAHVAQELVLKEPAQNRQVRPGPTLAPSLLVGADLHGGISRNFRIGLHLNVLDLGALASIRLTKPEVEDSTTGQEVADTDTSAEAAPEVRFEQVFAPGGLAYVGWRAFNLGAAVTFVPSLRPGRTQSGEIKPLHVLRVGAVLAVDVSILPLF
jgi:hypothetical protein